MADQNSRLNFQGLPAEMVMRVLASVPASGQEHKKMRLVSRLFQEIIDDPGFPYYAISQQLPEIKQLFNITNTTNISRTQLAQLHSLHARIIAAADAICTERPHARKDIIIQGLFVTDAKYILSQFLGDNAVPGLKEDLWRRSSDEYTAKVVRYTLRQAAYYLGESVLDPAFAINAIGANEELDSCMLKHAFESVALFEETDLSVANHILRKQSGARVRSHMLRHVVYLMGKFLFLRHMCATNRMQWEYRSLEQFGGFEDYCCISRIIDPWDAEDGLVDMAEADSFDHFFNMINDSNGIIAREFEDYGLTGDIDYRKIGDLFRGQLV